MLGNLQSLTNTELEITTRMILRRVHAQGTMNSFDEVELIQIADEIAERDRAARCEMVSTECTREILRSATVDRRSLN